MKNKVVVNKTKFPYICQYSGETENLEFVPTVVDYDNEQVWRQIGQASENGEWFAFDEVIFTKIKSFIELENRTK